MNPHSSFPEEEKFKQDMHCNVQQIPRFGVQSRSLCWIIVEGNFLDWYSSPQQWLEDSGRLPSAETKEEKSLSSRSNNSWLLRRKGLLLNSLPLYKYGIYVLGIKKCFSVCQSVVLSGIKSGTENIFQNKYILSLMMRSPALLLET